MLLTPGTLVDGYRIEAEIGRGGMAVVYRARQLNLQRDVALKMVLDGYAQQPDLRVRFRHEALAVARLRHPAILVIHDVGEYHGSPYLVTELVEGGTLAALLGSPLPLDRVARLLRPVAEALDQAHDQGILHRDVKPSNILLRRDGTPVLADFGLARAMASDPGLTRTGLVLGTPAYMAPEQAVGSTAGLTGAVDRYALAVVAYELLTGTPPFSGPTPFAVALAHVQQPPPAPHLRNPAIGAGVEAVLLQGLAKEPGARPPHAVAFIEALAAGGGIAQGDRDGSTVVVPAVVVQGALEAHQRTSGSVPTVVADARATRPLGESAAGAVTAQATLPAAVPAGGRWRRLLVWALGVMVLAVAVLAAAMVLQAREGRAPGTRSAAVARGPVASATRAAVARPAATATTVRPTLTVTTVPPSATVTVRTTPVPTPTPRAVTQGLLASLPVGAITTYAGGLGNGTAHGVPTSFGLAPSAVAVAGPQLLLIADSAANVVWLVNQGDRAVQRYGRHIAAGQMAIVAGDATAGFRGDGRVAGQAQLNGPDALALDRAGNLYIADTLNNRVREVHAGSGIITTVAGNGKRGSRGNGGPATRAELDQPEGLALDRASNLYIADWGNNRVREVHAGSGIITTVAGNGKRGSRGNGGPATRAELDQPEGLTVNPAGNLYIADAGNNAVREVHAGSGIITAVAGNGQEGYTGDGGPAIQAELKRPEALAFDQAGNLYVADMVNNVVREVHAGTGTITTAVAGTAWPAGLAFDQAGNLYIAETDYGWVREVHAGTGAITTVAGNGPTVVGFNYYGGDGGSAIQAELSGPEAVAVDAAGNLYIADQDNDRVREVHAGSGIITTVAGTGIRGYTGDGGPATRAELNVPWGLAVDHAGDLFIADWHNNRVREVHAASGIITTVVGTGKAGFTGDGGPAIQAELSGPSALAFDQVGNLYIADGDRVREVHAGSGIITTVAGNGQWGFSGNGGPATLAELNQPEGLVVDSTGDLYIADFVNHMVREVHASSGIITTVAGNGQEGYTGDGGPAIQAELNLPEGLAMDHMGNLYIADWNNHVVREVHTGTGIITTVAGNGSEGYRGDGGPATRAELYAPEGLAVDQAGNLYIADAGNNRVRVVRPGTHGAPASIIPSDTPTPDPRDRVVMSTTTSMAGATTTFPASTAEYWCLANLPSTPLGTRIVWKWLHVIGTATEEIWTSTPYTFNSALRSGYINGPFAPGQYRCEVIAGGTVLGAADFTVLNPPTPTPTSAPGAHTPQASTSAQAAGAPGPVDACAGASTPENIVVHFYLAISERHFPAAYQCLDAALRAKASVAAFAQGYATTAATQLLIADRTPAGKVWVDLHTLDKTAAHPPALTDRVFQGVWSVTAGGHLAAPSIALIRQSGPTTSSHALPVVHQADVLSFDKQRVLRHLRVGFGSDPGTRFDFYVTHAGSVQHLWIFRKGALVFAQTTSGLRAETVQGNDLIERWTNGATLVWWWSTYGFEHSTGPGEE